MREFLHYCRKDILKKRNLAIVFFGLVSLYIIVLEKTTVSFRIRGSLLIALSFCLSYLLTPVLCSIAWRLGIVDHPSKRKMHQHDTPLLGGGILPESFSTL